jgi:hypothetical protein
MLAGPVAKTRAEELAAGLVRFTVGRSLQGGD